MENGTLTIALLGQPNSGKSSVFNGLTGAHQHVGNWPGKTVEHKSGSFTQNGTDYAVVDLPGSYSLSAGSQEEVVTTSYIRSGKADLVAILVDSSQLERSLYMLADFIGTRIPAVLILNLMDVAEQKGVKIDTAKLSARLGIPVIGFVAADRKRYPALKAQLADAAAKKQLLREDALMQYYRADAALGFAALADSQEKSSVYTQEKQAILALEEQDATLMTSAKYKYQFIDALLAGAVQKPARHGAALQIRPRGAGGQDRQMGGTGADPGLAAGGHNDRRADYGGRVPHSCGHQRPAGTAADRPGRLEAPGRDGLHRHPQRAGLYAVDGELCRWREPCVQLFGGYRLHGPHLLRVQQRHGGLPPAGQEYVLLPDEPGLQHGGRRGQPRH